MVRTAASTNLRNRVRSGSVSVIACTGRVLGNACRGVLADYNRSAPRAGQRTTFSATTFRRRGNATSGVCRCVFRTCRCCVVSATGRLALRVVNGSLTPGESRRAILSA